MSRKPHPLHIEEQSGEKYSSLTEAQRVAVSPLAADIVDTIRALLAKGILINQNGKIIPDPNHQNSKLEKKDEI